MEATVKIETDTSVPDQRRAYDPNNLHPLDAEDRKHDDNSEGIDWDEIIATTQDDFEAGRYTIFNPNDYPTEEAFVDALVKSWNVEVPDAIC